MELQNCRTQRNYLREMEDFLERQMEVRGAVGCVHREVVLVKVGASFYGNCIPASHCQWAQ